jgi:hypothetical protein
MGETRSERPSCSEYFIISQQAAIKSGVDRLQATHDKHLVLTGQSLEVNRQALETCRQALEAIKAMGKPTAPPPPSGPPSPWTTMKDYAKDFVLLTKLWAALRSGPWGILAWLGYGLLKWLGVLS